MLVDIFCFSTLPHKENWFQRLMFPWHTLLSSEQVVNNIHFHSCGAESCVQNDFFTLE